MCVMKESSYEPYDKTKLVGNRKSYTSSKSEEDVDLFWSRGPTFHLQFPC